MFTDLTIGYFRNEKVTAPLKRFYGNADPTYLGYFRNEKVTAPLKRYYILNGIF